MPICYQLNFEKTATRNLGDRRRAQCNLLDKDKEAGGYRTES